MFVCLYVCNTTFESLELWSPGTSSRDVGQVRIWSSSDQEQKSWNVIPPLPRSNCMQLHFSHWGAACACGAGKFQPSYLCQRCIGVANNCYFCEQNICKVCLRITFAGGLPSAGQHARIINIIIGSVLQTNFWVLTPKAKTNSAFHPSGISTWVPASAGKAKAATALTALTVPRHVRNALPG